MEIPIIEMKAGQRFMVKTNDGMREFIKTDKASARGWPKIVRIDTGELIEIPTSFVGHPVNR